MCVGVRKCGSLQSLMIGRDVCYGERCEDERSCREGTYRLSRLER